MRLAMATPVHLERPDIDPFRRVGDEMNKVVVTNPVTKIGRQKKRLGPIVGYEIYHHQSINY